MLPFDTPQVAVTGASRGIGRAIAVAFGREGAHVFLIARTETGLRETAAAVVAAGGSATVVACDVARGEDTARAAATIQKETSARHPKGRLDALVNNAGIFRVSPFLESDPEKHWRDLIDTNLSGTFLPTLRLMPLLLESPRPHLFNILSVAALQGFPWNAGYGAAKWGARGLTECLRAEFADRLRITAVYPGATDTAAWNGIPFPHRREHMLRPEAIATKIVAAWKAPTAPSEIHLATPPGAVGA
jgi:NAD(P)-dependent dehydrogenase (short-subunit alcohol dehydrogenase family)